MLTTKQKFEKFAKKEIMLFAKSRNIFFVSFRPNLAAQGAVVFATTLALLFSVSGFIFPLQEIEQASVVRNVQVFRSVVAGQSIKYKIFIDKDQLSQSEKYLKIPQSAKNVKISVVSRQEADSEKNQIVSEVFTNEQRIILAQSSKPKFFLASFFDIAKYLLSDLEEGVAQIVEEIVNPEPASEPEPEIVETENSSYVDLSSVIGGKQQEEQKQKEDQKEEKQEAKQEKQEEKAEEKAEKQEEPVPLPVEEPVENPVEPIIQISEEAPVISEMPEEPLIETTSLSDQSVIVPEEQPEVVVQDVPVPVVSEDENKVVVVEYETETAQIAEEETDTGKLVTVSAEQALDEPPLTDVVAFTTIPEIYKVGQEDKIKIKWVNENNQEMTFRAYDLNGNGKLDYVEWTVPHLSEQIFEIIFISKAFRLDADKNITEDIYEYAQAQDDNWVTINNGEYVRVTFEQILDNTKDNTIYVKPTDPNNPATIQVYAQAPSGSGSNDIYAEQLVATFENIDHEGLYKVLLTDLEVPTDVFDLKIIGGSIDFDYIVDPIGWLAGWGFRKKITISNSNVDADLDDFPLYVKVSADADIGDEAQADGDDVRFTSSDGTTLLSYEEESWTGGGGADATANFWVKTDVDHDADTEIYIYYGKADAEDGQDVVNVWDASFEVVQHLEESAGWVAGGEGYIQDSTLNNNDGQAYGNADATTGQIGGAGVFDGNGDYIEKTSFTFIQYPLTISAWTLNTSLYDGLYHEIVTRGGTQQKNSNFGFSLRRHASLLNSRINLDWWNATNYYGTEIVSPLLDSTTNWVFVTGVVDAENNISLYVNGALVGTDGSNLAPTDGSQPLRIGAWYGTQSTSAYFKGSLDEIRISSTNRSAAWIEFEYCNMTSTDEATCGASNNFEISFEGEDTNSTPNVPILVSPENASYTTDTTPTLSANYSDNDTGDVGTTNYGIATSAVNCLAETFVSGCGGTCTGTSAETADEDEDTTWTPGSAMDDGTYYWCAQNDDGVAHSAWTSMGSFILDTTAPTFTITSPTNSTYYTNTSVSFTASETDTNSGFLVSNLDSSLVSWWRMDDIDGSGNPTDYVGSNNLTKYGNATQTSSGKFGKAFAFDGASDFLYVTNNSTLNPTTGITISAWIKSNVSDPTDRGLVSKWTTGTTGYMMVCSSGKIRGYIGGTYAVSSSSISSTSVWYHVLYTWNGSVIQTYINGAADGTPAAKSSITSDSGSLQIGTYNSRGQSSFNGSIDEVMIFNRALTADEITALYNATAISHSSTLSEASHTYKVYSTDLAGNTATSDTSTFTVDATAPTAAITYSNSNPVKSGDSLTITATFNEAMADSPVPKISISGSNTLAATNMTKTDTTHYYYTHTVGAGDGTATVALSVGTDVAGNAITSAPTSGATFTVDNTAPTNQDTVFASSTSKVGGASVTIVSSGDATNNVWFAPSGTTTFVAGATMTTAGGTATSILAPATAGAYRMFVIDAVGNYSTQSTAILTVDNTTPDIVSVDAGASSGDRTSLTSDTWFKYSDTGSDDQVSFSWTDPSSASDDTFYYEFNADSGSTITGDESTASNPYIDSIAITEGTNYFHVRPKNGAGTWGTERTFTVKYDKTAPATIADGGTYTFGEISSEAVTVTLIPDDGEGSGVLATLYCTDTENTCTPETSYSDSFEVSAEGTSYIRFYSTDNASNEETPVNSETVAVDTTSPAVDAGSNQNKSSQFTQTGSVTDDFGIASYAWSMVSGPGVVSFGSANSSSTTISVSVTGTYVIRLTAADNAGNSASDDFTLVWTQSSTGGGNTYQPGQATQQPVRQIQQQEREQSQSQGANIVQNLTQQISNLRNQIAQIISQNASQSLQIAQQAREAVPEETPQAFSPQNFVLNKTITELDLSQIKSDASFFAQKLPEFSSVMADLGIETGSLNDVKKLNGFELALPGLTETVMSQKGLAVGSLGQTAGIPVADLTLQAKQNMPTDIVFAKTAGELVDIKTKLSFDDKGNAQQSISIVSGKPLQLVFKPDAPAKRVTGFVFLKQNNVGEESSGLDFTLAKYFAAALISDYKETAVSTPKLAGGLLVDKFEYTLTTAGIYQAEVKAPALEGEYEITTVVEYKDEEMAPKETKLNAVVDPEGYVYEQMKQGRLRIQGATVTIYWLDPQTNNYEIWDAVRYLQKNPILTDETGKYSFLVPAGKYYLEAFAPGYFDYESEEINVPEGGGVQKDIKMEKSNLFGRLWRWIFKK